MVESVVSRQPIFRSLCDEKKGRVIRSVMVYSQTDDPGYCYLMFVAHRLKWIPSMFSAVPTDQMQAIFDVLDKGWYLLPVDDVGVLGVGTTMIDNHVDVHVTFWDRVLRGRERLCRQACEWAIEQRQAEGAYTAIPASSHATIAFAKRVGFEVVGWNLRGARDRFGYVDDAVVMRYTNCTLQSGGTNGS